MATRKQIAANRRNAQKSTGPRTQAGKERSARNAVTHGLTSAAPILPDEDAAEYAAFADGVRADLAPSGALEEALAARVAVSMWRLLRISLLEAACFAHELAQASERAGLLREIPGLPPIAANGEEHALGAAFRKLDAEGLPNSLGRYEAAIQRGMERSLKLLTDLQKQRRDAENTELRNKAYFPGAQAGQCVSDETQSRRGGVADNGRGAGDIGLQASSVVAGASEVMAEIDARDAVAKPKRVRSLMEQRKGKNSRRAGRAPGKE